MTLRLFAALDLPAEIAARLEGVQAGLPGRLVDPANFHVTLSFFGDLDEAAAEDLHDALAGLTATGFEMWIDGADIFGGAAPRLVFAKVRPDPALSALHAAVRGAARAAGVSLAAERYVPHVTLARKPISADARLTRWLTGAAGFLAGPIEVERFALFRSDLYPTGPIYTEIASYDLGPRVES